MIVVIPCGARKRPGTHPAADLYTGPYFKACLAYARSITAEENIYVLSAKYGLLALSDPVASYERTLGQPGAITTDEVRLQARRRALLGEEVVALGGRRYTRLCKDVWPRAHDPLQTRVVGGQGRHMAALRRNRGRAPQAWR